MAGSAGAIRVEGLTELNRAFAKMSGGIKVEMRAALAEAGEPVRARAEALAASEIRNIGEQWSRMRLGVTSRLVYVAPKARRRGGSARPNLAPLLMNRAMQPALEANTEWIVHALERMVDKLGGENGF